MFLGRLAANGDVIQIRVDSSPASAMNESRMCWKQATPFFTPKDNSSELIVFSTSLERCVCYALRRSTELNTLF